MKRRIVIYLYLAVLICEDKSDALSSSISLEDSLNTYDITAPQNPARQEVEENDQYEMFDDFRATNHKIDPEIIRDDLNLYVEKINRKKSKLDFERDGFHNTPTLHKNRANSKIINKHPSVSRKVHSNMDKTANSGITNDFIVNVKVDGLFGRKSRSPASENVPKVTQILNDFKPNTHKSKHKHIEPLPDGSQELDASYATLLSNLKKSKKSEEHKKSNIFNKVVKKLNTKNSRLNKQQQSSNHSDSQNKHVKSKNSGIRLENKKYIKDRQIQPELDITLEQAEVLSKEQQYKTQKKKPDMFNKVVKKPNNKYSRLNKQQQSTNHSDLQNKHVKSKNSENKEYIKDHHIQPELDTALEQAEILSKEQQNETQNKKSSHNIKSQSSTDFVTSKAEVTKRFPIVKNVNENPRSQKDKFTLTVSDINDENEEQFKANNLPSHQGSTLLDVDASVYQHMLSQVPDEPNKVSSISEVLQNNKAKSLKSTLKQSPIAKQQPVEIGMIDKNKGEHYEQLDEIFKIDHRDPHVSLGDKSNAKTEGIVGDKPKLDNIKSENTASHPEKKIDVKLNKNYKHNTIKQAQPKVEKKNFDVPLDMNDKQDKLTNKEKGVHLHDDFSKAEIILTDSNESDDKSADGFINEHDTSDYSNSESIKHIQRGKHIGNILRNYKKSCTCKKSVNKCRKACKGAYSSVCRRLKCSSKARRNLSNQCKKYCVKTFRSKK